MPHHITLTSPLPEDDLRFESMTVSEGLSTLGEMNLTLVSRRSDVKPEDLLGKIVTVKVELHEGRKRFFHGHVTRFGMGRPSGRQFGYRATVRPWLWFLTRTADCRIFQEMTVPEIVKKVFEDHGVAQFEFNLFRSYRKWNYCVQYRESDFNFIARLLEHEGIYWYFSHDDSKHKLVLVDSHSAHDAAPQCDSLPYVQSESESPGHAEFVTNWVFTREIRTGKVVTTSYDFERPSTSLLSDRAHPREHDLGDYEEFDYQGDYTQADDGSHWAENRIDEHLARHEQLRGSSNAQGLTYGHVLTLERHPREDQNAKYLVVATTIRAHQPIGESEGGQHDYHCDFSAIPAAQQYRPPRRTPKPFVQGPQTAVVVGPKGDEIHTDKHGRVKVQFHWDRYGQRNEKSSCWIRVASVWAGKSFGFVQIPRIGHEVVVDFLEGDPDQPLITGRVYNADNMPPWDLPANATQSGVLTRSTKGGAYGNANEIKFEDKKGSEMLSIHAEKDMSTSVENDETRSIAHDQTTKVGNHQTVVVDKGRDVFVNDKGETYYVKGPRVGYYDGHQTQSVTQGYDTFVTQTRGEYTTGDRIMLTTGMFNFKSTKAYFDVGPEYLVTGVKLGLTASGAMFFEAGADHNSKAANFKFTSTGNFNFTGNQFNRTIFEGNDTILGPNTNTYIGSSRDTAIGSAAATFIGQQNNVTTGMATDGFLGLQMSTFAGMSISNALALSISNAAINLGGTGIDLGMSGVSLENNSLKLINAGGAGAPAGSVAFAGGSGTAALAGIGFGAGASLAALVGGVVEGVKGYEQALADAAELINNTPGLTQATKDRLQRVLDNATSPLGGPMTSPESYRAEAEPGRTAQLNNLVNPPPGPPAPGTQAPPTAPTAPAVVAPLAPSAPSNPLGR